jgi:hypothetical protein
MAENFKYVGGNLEGVDIGTKDFSIHDTELHGTKCLGICKISSALSKKGNTSIHIPWEHIVEISYSTDSVSVKKSKLGRGLLGLVLGGAVMLTPLGPVVAGAKIVAAGATAATMAVAGATTGAGVGAVTGVGKTQKNQTTFMISYLDKDDCEKFQVLLFQYAGLVMTNEVEFFDSLIEKADKTKKAKWVLEAQKKLEDNREKALALWENPNVNFSIQIEEVEIDDNDEAEERVIVFGKLKTNDDLGLAEFNNVSDIWWDNPRPIEIIYVVKPTGEMIEYSVEEIDVDIDNDRLFSFTLTLKDTDTFDLECGYFICKTDEPANLADILFGRSNDDAPTDDSSLEITK